MATCKLLKYNVENCILKKQMDKDDLSGCDLNFITLEPFADDDMMVVFRRTSPITPTTYICFELGGLHEWLQRKRRPSDIPYFPPYNLDFYSLPSSAYDIISKKDARKVSQRACIYFNDCQNIV